jgi:hypothetical protein
MTCVEADKVETLRRGKRRLLLPTAQNHVHAAKLYLVSDL